MSKAARLKAASVKITHHIGGLRTTIPAQMAVAGPPLGTQLGQLGINIATFVKDFNLRTSIFREGVPLPTRTTVNPDRSYNLVIHHPTATYFLKQAAGVKRGAQYPGREVTGYITRKHLYEIAVVKGQDPPLQMEDLQEVCRLLIDSANSLGIKVVDKIDPVEYQQFLEERKEIVMQQKDDLQAAKEAKLLRTA
eukprot:TRINITY_DN47132_c0_g1_i1.p1 TRINITY_DN47132_c0_g1~~TRINITY_DN47132_c0_g1_i1.p1  ORF type:complete len:194 (-),score=68.94 TRINITY_DN47132_c0_g1_i1:51-632(-)